MGKGYIVVVAVIVIVALYIVAKVIVFEGPVKDLSERWATLLKGQDFGTGLLSSDLSEPQPELIEKWAIDRDFREDREWRNLQTEDYMSWDYRRDKSLRLVYAYRSKPYITHSLKWMHVVGPSEPINPVEGIPPELNAGASVKDVLDVWGVGSWTNKREVNAIRFNPKASVALSYDADFPKYKSRLWMEIIGGLVETVGYEIIPKDIAADLQDGKPS